MSTTSQRKTKWLTMIVFCLISATYSQAQTMTPREPSLVQMAVATFDSTRACLATTDRSLLMEQYPRQPKDNKCSFLWGYSALLSGVSALCETTGDKRWLKTMDGIMLRGLDKYYDKRRQPAAYASYLNVDAPSDRYYDDNIWLGIDMADLYQTTHNGKYLKRAEEIWAFVMSGCDDKLGGGIYWCEQKKMGKNTCSNAPASVMALKLYVATGKESYLAKGKELYEWTRAKLEDPADHLYFDNLSLRGRIGKEKYSYNSGQMMQAAALLYQITADSAYLQQAQLTAKACYDRFFEEAGGTTPLLKGGQMWFDAVMVRGFIELYRIDHQPLYLEACKASVLTAWNRARSAQGLFSGHYNRIQPVCTLLNQAAMVEMYARLSTIESYQQSYQIK
jgi:predicted alpha-1,6-mannanase (GH76 family)